MCICNSLCNSLLKLYIVGVYVKLGFLVGIGTLGEG